MRTPRIGIMGPANAGKDTVAVMLSEMTGFPVRHFSGAVYREVSAAFRITENRLRDRCTKERPSPWLTVARCTDPVFKMLMREMQIAPLRPHSPRQILEWWGTNYRRSADQNYWTRPIATDLRPVILPDVRFQNEADICTGLIRVLRPGVHVLRNHESDQLWRNHEGIPTILNNGSLDDLREQVAGMGISLNNAIPL